MTNKQLIVFDLDGTLVESKSRIDPEMTDLLMKILQVKKIAVISGASYMQFQTQFLVSFPSSDSYLKNLFLFPTCSTSFYRYNACLSGRQGEWQCVYSQNLTPEEVDQIKSAFARAFEETGYMHPEKTYGEVLENRGSQVTFSALGQEAPLEQKSRWDPDGAKRKKIKTALEKYLPGFEVRVGGTTSLDVTRKGIDKAYAISQIEKHVGIPRKEMLFIGDALFEGGNDYPVKQAGVECVSVSGPEDTKRVLRGMLL